MFLNMLKYWIVAIFLRNLLKIFENSPSPGGDALSLHIENNKRARFDSQ